MGRLTNDFLKLLYTEIKECIVLVLYLQKNYCDIQTHVSPKKWRIVIWEKPQNYIHRINRRRNTKYLTQIIINGYTSVKLDTRISHDIVIRFVARLTSRELAECVEIGGEINTPRIT